MERSTLCGSLICFHFEKWQSSGPNLYQASLYTILRMSHKILIKMSSNISDPTLRNLPSHHQAQTKRTSKWSSCSIMCFNPFKYPSVSCVHTWTSWAEPLPFLNVPSSKITSLFLAPSLLPSQLPLTRSHQQRTARLQRYLRKVSRQHLDS